jgi:ribose 5-phosphate isomerase A
MGDASRAKEAVGRRAAELVVDGMKVGLGTGSTVHFTIVALGERRPDVVCVATSKRTAHLAAELGLRVESPDAVGALDIAIDGADEVDPDFHLIKGGGGAHAREKIVAEMAKTFVVVVDHSKVVEQLGAFGVPLEVLPFAPGIVEARVRDIGARAVQRLPEPTDNGNVLLRADFGEIDYPPELAVRLESIPGLVEHGLFLGENVARVFVGNPDGHAEELERG